MKNCKFCSKPLSRKLREQRSIFINRITCGRACAGRLSKQSIAEASRNLEIANLYLKYPARAIAKKFKISHQRVFQIVKRAEKRGQIDYGNIPMTTRRTGRPCEVLV